MLTRVSAVGLVYSYRLRDDAYFHNGRKMTVDDLIWSWTRVMDGSKGYPGARYVRLIKGAVAVEKGEAKEISGLKKIDDFTLEMTITDISDPGFYFFDGTTAILPGKRSRNFASNPVGLGPSGSRAHSGFARGRRALRQVLQAGRPYADRIVFVIIAEAAACVAPQGDRHLDPVRAIRRLSSRSAALKGISGRRDDARCA